MIASLDVMCVTPAGENPSPTSKSPCYVMWPWPFLRRGRDEIANGDKMRVRAISATALLVASLGLTACEGNKGDNAGGEKPASSASATSKGSEGKDSGGSGSGSGAGKGDSGKGDSGKGDTGGSSTSGGGDTGADGDGQAPPCSNDIADASFVLGKEGSDSEFAEAFVTIENITDETCLITGGITLSAEDYVMVDNAELSDKPIEVGPNMSVSAPVEFPDVPIGEDNPEDGCFQSDKVQVGLLPEDEDLSVDVTDGDGEPAMFNVCDADEVSLGELAP
ncbi:hypothetical protein [Streptomyces sp. NPDC048639]|uniref:hypothetical protein n=1 Tax=Streptomyces sp. NPDC048639 TaxID=3365581 RepID=UPI0037244792